MNGAVLKFASAKDILRHYLLYDRQVVVLLNSVTLLDFGH
jgi:hypothetical protein